MAKTPLYESTIEDELQAIGDGENLTLSEIRMAIQRIVDGRPRTQHRQYATNFLGMLADQLGLPGLLTSTGQFFIYNSGNRDYDAKSALPQYMSSEELQPLADRGLIPPEVADSYIEAGLITGYTTAAPPPNGVVAEPLPPAERNTGQPRTVEPLGGTTTTSTEALQRFVGLNRGGLANDPDQVEAINELQSFLVELGLNVGNNGVDGRYGNRTAEAVRRFQTAMDLDDDGDAGENTIAKIVEVRTDMARIQELLDILTNESASPIQFKSAISKLLERQLRNEEREELQQLLDKYEDFRGTFRTFNAENFAAAETALTNANDQPQTRSISPNQSSGELVTGDGIDWEQVDLAPENIQDRDGVPNNSVLLQTDTLPDDNITVEATPIQGTELTYRVGTYDGDTQNATVPESLIFAINQEIERRQVEPERVADPNEGFEEFTGGTPPEGFKLYIRRGETPVFRWGRGDEINPQDFDTWPAAQRAAQAVADREAASAAGRNNEAEMAELIRTLSAPDAVITPADVEGVAVRALFPPLSEHYNAARRLLEKYTLENNSIIRNISLDTLYEALLLEGELTGEEAVELQRRYRNVLTIINSPQIQQLLADGGDQSRTLQEIVRFLDSVPDEFVGNDINADQWERNNQSSRPQSTAPQYGDDFSTNLELYLGTNRSLEETNRFLESIPLDNASILNEISAHLRDLVLKLARGDNPVRVSFANNDTITVTLDPAETPSESAERIREFNRGELARAIEAARTNVGDTPQAKAAQLRQALQPAAFYNNVDREAVDRIILSIQTAEEYNAIDQEYRRLNPRAESLWSEIDAQWFYSTYRIEHHLRNIGVNIQESIINITKRIVER